MYSDNQEKEIVVENVIDKFLYERRMMREFHEFIDIVTKYLASNLSRMKSMDEKDGKFVIAYKGTGLRDLIIP
jgi:hypothetical protein